jgi:integrase
MVPMKSVFDMAFKEGIVLENVMRKIKRLREESPDIHPFSYSEIYKILDAIDPWYQPYARVAFFSGMRAGELNALQWSDYKPRMPDGPEIHIRRAFVYGEDGSVKTKKSIRNIQCLPEVVESLENQRRLTGSTNYIFLAKDGSRMTPDHFRKVIWETALKEAGIKYRPPIQTRHTFATMMLSAGEDIGWVQRMLGHSSLQMIYQRYYSWIPHHTRSDGQAFRRFVKKVQENSTSEEGTETTEIEEGQKEGGEEPEKTGDRCTNIVPVETCREKRRNRKALSALN